MEGQLQNYEPFGGVQAPFAGSPPPAGAPVAAAAAPAGPPRPARWAAFDELRLGNPSTSADEAEREKRVARIEQEILTADEDAVMNIACPIPVPWPVRSSPP